VLVVPVLLPVLYSQLWCAGAAVLVRALLEISLSQTSLVKKNLSLL
jgi:hypothetical protein